MSKPFKQVSFQMKSADGAGRRITILISPFLGVFAAVLDGELLVLQIQPFKGPAYRSGTTNFIVSKGFLDGKWQMLCSAGEATLEPTPKLYTNDQLARMPLGPKNELSKEQFEKRALKALGKLNLSIQPKPTLTDELQMSSDAGNKFHDKVTDPEAVARRTGRLYQKFSDSAFAAWSPEIIKVAFQRYLKAIERELKPEFGELLFTEVFSRLPVGIVGQVMDTYRYTAECRKSEDERFDVVLSYSLNGNKVPIPFVGAFIPVTYTGIQEAQFEVKAAPKKARFRFQSVFACLFGLTGVVVAIPEGKIIGPAILGAILGWVLAWFCGLVIDSFKPSANVQLATGVVRAWTRIEPVVLQFANDIATPKGPTETPYRMTTS